MENTKQLQSIELVSLQNTLDYLGISQDEFVSLAESEQLKPHFVDGVESYKATPIKLLKFFLKYEKGHPSKAVDCLESISETLSALEKIGDLFYSSTTQLEKLYKAIGEEDGFDFNRYDEHFQNLRNRIFDDLHQLLIELPNHCD